MNFTSSQPSQTHCNSTIIYFYQREKTLKPSEIIGQDLFEVILSHMRIGFFGKYAECGRYPVSNIINVYTAKTLEDPVQFLEGCLTIMILVWRMRHQRPQIENVR